MGIWWKVMFSLDKKKAKIGNSDDSRIIFHSCNQNNTWIYFDSWITFNTFVA